MQVDVAALPVAERTGNGGRHYLAGTGTDRNPGRHAEEDQKWRQNKATADTEHAGEHADRQPHAEQHGRIERKLGDGKIDLHRSMRRELGSARMSMRLRQGIPIAAMVRHHNLSRQLLQPTANEFCRIDRLAQLVDGDRHRLARLAGLIAKVGQRRDRLRRRVAGGHSRAAFLAPLGAPERGDGECRRLVLQLRDDALRQLFADPGACSTAAQFCSAMALARS